MFWFRYALLGLLVSLSAVVGMRPSEAQTGAASRGAAEAGARNAPTAAANGEGVKAAHINNCTVGIAAGLLEGSFIRFASELAKALDDGENLRILPTVTYGAKSSALSCRQDSRSTWMRPRSTWRWQSSSLP